MSRNHVGDVQATEVYGSGPVVLDGLDPAQKSDWSLNHPMVKAWLYLAFIVSIPFFANWRPF